VVAIESHKPVRIYADLDFKPKQVQNNKKKGEYMNLTITVTQKQLSELLLNISVVMLVFIWGPPGIGKSSLVQQFTEINRMMHVQLKVSHHDWLEWASVNGIHPYIIEYINLRPDHL